MPTAHFPDISPLAWEHPADAATMASLRAVPGLDSLVGATMGRANEAVQRWRFLSNAQAADAATQPRAHRIWTEVCHALDAPTEWPLYVAPMGGPNAMATGMDRPFVLLAEEALPVLDDGAVRTILAHELGHLLSGHVRYKTIVRLLAGLSTAAMSTIWAAPVTAGALAALLAWDRASELSADRAAVLATGDPTVVVGTLLRLSGPPPSTPTFIAERGLGPAYHDLRRLVRTHPEPAERVDAVREWIETDDYKAILDGYYPRGDDARRQAPRWLRDRATVLARGLLQRVQRDPQAADKP